MLSNAFSCHRRLAVRFVACLSVLSACPSVMSQATGLLYDPEPPVDSAYIRILLAADLNKAAILIDGKARGVPLSANQSSDYMVLPAGTHQIQLATEGKKATLLKTQLEVVRGRAMTVAFVSAQPSDLPVVFEDKTSSNKLKAMLSVYQLAVKTHTVDVLTGDGATKVFSALGYGTSGALQVNPINVALIATRTGEMLPMASASMTMAQGAAYSVFLLPGKDGKAVATVVQNKIERYTGK